MSVRRSPVTIEAHQAFRESLQKRPAARFDEIDHFMADPVHDHAPEAAPQRQVKRVLSILDEIAADKFNRGGWC